MISNFGLIGYICLYFLQNVYPWLKSLEPHIGYPPTPDLLPADPYYYLKFSTYPIVEIPWNVFGPTLFAKLLAGNFLLIYLSNLTLLLIAIRKLSNNLKLNYQFLLFLFLINPCVSVNLFYVNKEIYSLFAVIFLICWVEKPHKWLLLLAIIFSIFSKVEIVFAIGIAAAVDRTSKNFKLFAIITTIFIITLFYKLISGLGGRATVLNNINSDSFSLTRLIFNLNSEYYLFFLTLIPKFLMNLTTPIIASAKKMTIDYFLFGSLIQIWFFGKSIFNAKIRSRNHTIIFFTALWIILTSAIPFTYFRYLIPLYPLFVYLGLHTNEDN